jgi:H/ACA ribonucleoprotein complex subunit 4
LERTFINIAKLSHSMHTPDTDSSDISQVSQPKLSQKVASTIQTTYPELVCKINLPTDTAYGSYPTNATYEQRIANGIVIIDKPKGPTSHQVSGWVKELLHIDIAGHCGTLDPAVTGVLPIALGGATRALQALLEQTKEYVCLMHIHKPLEPEKIHSVCNSFVGTISQLPPIKSAVKRQIRQRDIHELEILQIKGQFVLFRVLCQAGTYIRKLCHDIGVKLGCGAHMAQLIRTKASHYSTTDMVSMNTLLDAYIFATQGNPQQLLSIVRPVEDIISHLPKIIVSDSAIGYVLHGAPLAIPGVCFLSPDIKKQQIVALLSLKGELIGLAKAQMTSQKILELDKGHCARPLRILMPIQTYPKGVGITVEEYARLEQEKTH